MAAISERGLASALIARLVERDDKNGPGKTTLITLFEVLAAADFGLSITEAEVVILRKLLSKGPWVVGPIFVGAKKAGRIRRTTILIDYTPLCSCITGLLASVAISVRKQRGGGSGGAAAPPPATQWRWLDGGPGGGLLWYNVQTGEQAALCTAPAPAEVLAGLHKTPASVFASAGQRQRVLAAHRQELTSLNARIRRVCDLKQACARNRDKLEGLAASIAEMQVASKQLQGRLPLAAGEVAARSSETNSVKREMELVAQRLADVAASRVSNASKKLLLTLASRKRELEAQRSAASRALSALRDDRLPDARRCLGQAHEQLDEVKGRAKLVKQIQVFKLTELLPLHRQKHDTGRKVEAARHKLKELCSENYDLAFPDGAPAATADELRERIASERVAHAESVRQLDEVSAAFSMRVLRPRTSYRRSVETALKAVSPTLAAAATNAAAGGSATEADGKFPAVAAARPRQHPHRRGNTSRSDRRQGAAGRHGGGKAAPSAPRATRSGDGAGKASPRSSRRSKAGRGSKQRKPRDRAGREARGAGFRPSFGLGLPALASSKRRGGAAIFRRPEFAGPGERGHWTTKSTWQGAV